MSMEIVNGYVCQSCSDVALAKKGVNPAHPKDDPSNPGYDPKTAQADKAKASGVVTPAVVFGGALAGLNKTSSAQAASGATQVSGASSAASTGQGAASSVTTPASPTSSAATYASGTSVTAATTSPYSPGSLLNVSA
jgi:hypothetical protein